MTCDLTQREGEEDSGRGRRGDDALFYFVFYSLEISTAPLDDRGTLVLRSEGADLKRALITCIIITAQAIILLHLRPLPALPPGTLAAVDSSDQIISFVSGNWDQTPRSSLAKGLDL